ncbi:hypothetical protein MNBD_ACTINO02-1640 [hydrothermal vent metagenome]|uniref:Uncharacterized protein n=1 Tax=hydrothermal vent metagenome TaxID=652676 RepID=A0A3B0T0U7_9ZZZZ
MPNRDSLPKRERTGEGNRDTMNQRLRIVKKEVRMRMSRLLALSVAVAIVAAACEVAEPPNAGTPDVPSTTRSPTVSTAPAPPSVPSTTIDRSGPTAACGLVEFDASSIDLRLFESFTGEIDPLIGEEAQEEYLLSRDWWASFDWSVVESTDTALLLFGQTRELHDKEPLFANARFELGDEGWQAVSWGGCRIEMGRAGFGPASITINPEDPPNPDTTSLSLLAIEGACASGQAPIDREIIPVVVESEMAVDITTLVASPPGSQTCPLGPRFPITVQLSTELGDRVIRDAASYPVGELVWPLPPEDLFLALLTAGNPPAPGTANVVTWSGEQSGALLFGPDGWNTDPTFIQRFKAPGPMVISGFVTLCDETVGCPEELEPGEIKAIPRIGPECTLVYTPTPGQNIIMTIRFGDLSCAIDVKIGGVG